MLVCSTPISLPRNTSSLLTAPRRRPSRQHVLGIQRRHKCQAAPAHRTVPSTNPLFRHQDHSYVHRALESFSIPSPLFRLTDRSLPPIAQWHQWLRQTRHDPPSIREQQADVARQARLKHLAVLADERWASKPSLLDRPNIQSGLGTVPRDPAGYAGQTELEEKEGVRSAVRTPGEIGQGKGGKEDNPWKRQRGGPSEEFQPAAWSPGPVKR